MAGGTVTFAVVYADDDADVRANPCRTTSFGDGEGEGGACAVVACAAAYGPWTPPAPAPSRQELTLTHTYEKAGTYTARFSLSNSFCVHPYAGNGEREVTVTVL